MSNLLTLPPDSVLGRIRIEIERAPRLKSANTKLGYAADLEAFEQWRKGRMLTKLLVEEYAALLQARGFAPNTINRVLAAVRWWARRLADLAFEDQSLEPARREEISKQAARVASIKDVGGQREAPGRHLSEGELAALLRACKQDALPAGTRDAATIAIASATGARRFELAGLQLDDFLPVLGEEGELTIRGKGDKVRGIYVYEGAALTLADWRRIRGTEPGPLFYAINKAGNIQSGHGVSDEALAQMLEKRRQQAGLPHLTWHDFRRTFAGNLLDAGVDVVTVMKLMGHTSPTTTGKYDRRDKEVRRRAVRALHVPYGKDLA